MIVANIREQGRTALETLLYRMNRYDVPGMADPENDLLPFGAFDTLHFARFVIIDDRTLVDFRGLGLPAPKHPITLAFLGDCDGSVDDLYEAIATHPVASEGLGRIFAHCEGFDEADDLVGWMKAREHPPAAAYVNWTGRTVRQIREESVLHDALRAELTSYQSAAPERAKDAMAVRRHLQKYFAEHPELEPVNESKTPMPWLVENVLHFTIIPAALLLPWILALPFLEPLSMFWSWVIVLYLAFVAITFVYLVRRTNLPLAILSVPVTLLGLFFILFPLMLVPVMLALIAFFVVLRCYEKNEPEVIPTEPTARSDRRIAKLAELEDHDVSNQFTVVGSLKPGLFRLWLSSTLLWLINYGARHVYNRGHLGRIQTIHFARWTFIDDKQRVIFASNYDGTTEAYMDDFINKVGWGLNLAFGGGLGYPRVNWLILDGAKEEEKFKYTLRRHQLPTEVWYKAYPGLTAYDLARNARVHAGLKKSHMTESEIRNWLRDL